MNYRDALRWLYATQRFGIKLGLENTRRLFDSLGVPAPAQRILHVAGTNGKGSVCAMMDAICRAAGYRTALFTSPHLVTFRERIRVDGEFISEEEVAHGLTSIRRLIATWDPPPTFFEITTALALDHFRKVGADIIVLETGLGGRLDSTNAVQPIVSILTPIDYDHQKWLGHTLTEIAGEKAGIIKADVPVVSAAQPAEAAAVIKARAAACNAPLTFVRHPLLHFPVGLLGFHQKENAALALAALHAGNIPVDDAAIARGLAEVNWPARFQRWDDRTIIDGAHNPAGARALVRAWQETFGNQRATAILAVLNDKEVGILCHALAPIMGRALLPAIRSERALAPETLSLTIKGLDPVIRSAVLPSFAHAWRDAQEMEAPILITGSLHFAGEALAHLRGEPAAYEECLQ
ncbi:MAG: bifunctional folylpolyglutamate synthase/dihydrofolate synthase [Chthoniobacterales bacterium]|nr:bifunctional folylpolyglutamate synthase/dihydrofolate synthase [Chthoniobacterales bacterium]